MATKKAQNTAPAAAKAATNAEKTPAKQTSGAFAVIATGGKQYKVRVGDIVKIEKILKNDGEHKVGDKLVFGEVLLLDNAGSTSVGAPFVSGSKVEGEIKEIGRNDKITVVHYKQKSKYFKKYGHRQPFFKVAITAIA